MSCVTWDAVLPTDCLVYLVKGFSLACFHLTKPSPYPFNGLKSVNRLQQLLVGRGVLDYELGLAVDSENHRLPSFLQLVEKCWCVAFEVGQGINPFTQINHLQTLLFENRIRIELDAITGPFSSQPLLSCTAFQLSRLPKLQHP